MHTSLFLYVNLVYIWAYGYIIMNMRSDLSLPKTVIIFFTSSIPWKLILLSYNFGENAAKLQTVKLNKNAPDWQILHFYFISISK